MLITKHRELEIKAYEAFIRRAAKVNASFMLKGSYVTRQYFPDAADRMPADVDWVYLGKLAEEHTAREIFSDWVTEITELHLDDNVRFRSFRENEFWRRIDYAMHDDFPTVNTDLKCWVEQSEINFSLDISFNLATEEPPVPLLYKAIAGDAFTIEQTVPLSLQVSWKIHQTLVKPRFKDLFDLSYLVQHPDFNEEVLETSFKALMNECAKDNIDLARLYYFLQYDIAELFPDHSIEERWNSWRHNTNGNTGYFERASYLTDPEKLPTSLSEFLQHFKDAMESKGWTSTLLNGMYISLPERKRYQYEGSIEHQTVRNDAFNDSLVKKEVLIPKQSFWKRVKKIFNH